MYLVGNLCYEKYCIRIIIWVECIIDFCGRIWAQILEYYGFFILVIKYSRFVVLMWS